MNVTFIKLIFYSCVVEHGVAPLLSSIGQLDKGSLDLQHLHSILQVQDSCSIQIVVFKKVQAYYVGTAAVQPKQDPRKEQKVL